MDINYEAHISAQVPPQVPSREGGDIIGGGRNLIVGGGKMPEPPAQQKKVNSLLDFDDEPTQP